MIHLQRHLIVIIPEPRVATETIQVLFQMANNPVASKANTFNVVIPTMTPEAKTAALARLSKRSTESQHQQRGQIITYDRYALAIGDSEPGRRLAPKFVPEQLGDEASSDRGSMMLVDYLLKWQNYVVEMRDWLIRDMGGNMRRTENSRS
jgi:hypothetical protein